MQRLNTRLKPTYNGSRRKAYSITIVKDGDSTFWGVAVAFLLAVWQSMPVLVQVYLVLASLSLLLVALTALAHGDSGWRRRLRGAIARRVAIIVVLIATGYLANQLGIHLPQSDLSELALVASKVITVWYLGLELLELFDAMASLGVPVPQGVRDGLRQLLKRYDAPATEVDKDAKHRD